MNIGQYTFEEFKQRAADFHGYPAPGLLLGGYMVAMAKKALPEGILFEALVESKKCLPDAVQLLTVCSVGNNWMKVLDLGRYAVSLYDKYTGVGVRVYVDSDKIRAYPEYTAWFFKQKPKREQDSDQLFREIETAGDAVCSIMSVKINDTFLGPGPAGGIVVCPQCNEAYPALSGLVCRACQGKTPYKLYDPEQKLLKLHTHAQNVKPTPTVVPVEEAVGRAALHDMTEIIPGEAKGAAFSAGQIIGAGDVCRLQQMGRFSVAVEDGAPSGFVHENTGVEALAKRMAGGNIEYSLPPKEGKINFRASVDGLFTLDRARLFAVNMFGDVMCATVHDGAFVAAGKEVAGTRVIPLYIDEERLADVLGSLESPLFSIAPLRQAKVGILVTGTEVFKGLVEDKFIPLITEKTAQYGCTVVKSVIAPDDLDSLTQGIQDIRAAGADLLVTTGGMSVDPGDITRAALEQAGVCDMVYGAPALPGAMSLVGRLPGDGASTGMQVVGVPACALYFKTTFFDALLPRLLAGRELTRADMAAFGEGGFCQSCAECIWPRCGFLK